jgi:hypothetical protein
MTQRTAFVFCLAIMANGLLAQGVQYKPNFEITVIGGYQFGGSVDETYKLEGVDIHGESLGLEGSEMLGAAIDYRLGPKLLLEFSFDRQNTNLSFKDTTNTGFVKLADMHVGYYQAGLIYNWGAGSVQPYVGGTLGLTSMAPTEGLDSEVRFSAGPVFGVKTFSSKHFGFRFQTRLMITNMPKGEYFRNSAGESYNHVLNSYMTQLHFTLGLIVGL